MTCDNTAIGLIHFEEQGLRGELDRLEMSVRIEVLSLVR
jgi:hypothetical protein